MIDTSKEAVEQLALLHEGILFAEATGLRQCLVDVDDARFMHTLAAERDAQTARADAAEAEVARLTDESAKQMLADEMLRGLYDDEAADVARLNAELRSLRAGQDALVAAAYDAAAKVFDGTHRALREIDLLPHDKPSSFSEIAAIIRALTPSDATAALDAKLRAERNKALREVVAWCAHHTMEVPMDRGARKYAGMFDAGEHCGGTHQGMGYSDAILAMIETEANNDR